jgi:hypothetical protein
MTDKTNREKLRVIVSHAQTDVNLCAVAYKMMKVCDSEERAQIFEEFVKSVRRDKTDESMKLPVVITKREEANLMSRYGSYVDQKLEQFLKDNLEESDFYAKLADFIFDDEMLQDGKAGSIAIFDCIIDKRLPYHKVDTTSAITMDNDQFAKVLKSIGDDALETIDSAMSHDFDQKTERAGVVLNLIESRERKEERVAMLIRAFGHYEKQILQLHERELKRQLLKELMSDDEE